MKYEAILFDISDTLIEYTPSYTKIFGDRLRSLGYEITQEDASKVDKLVNWAIGEYTKRVDAGDEALSSEKYNAMMDRAALSFVTSDETTIYNHLITLGKTDIPKQKMSIIADVIEVLTELKKKYRLAVVSNHYSWLLDYLKECGLAQYFETIIISETVGVSKPNVEIMNIAMNEMNIEPKNCLYVGDHPYDVECSKGAGLDCAWIASAERVLPDVISFKEDYRIAKIIELLDVI